jgi:hypothetical protein
MGAYRERTICHIGKAAYRPALKNARLQALLSIPCDMAFSPGLYQRLDLVCGGGNGLIWDCGIESYIPNEGIGKKVRREELGVKAFWRGVITGAAGMLVLVLLVLAFRFFHNRDRKILEYMEAQHEIETLQEDIDNRPPDEFLEDPGVRGAADNAAGEFQRKRDEAVQRIRGGLSSKARLAD